MTTKVQSVGSAFLYMSVFVSKGPAKNVKCNTKTVKKIYGFNTYSTKPFIQDLTVFEKELETGDFSVPAC